MNIFSRATGALLLAMCLLGSSTLTLAQTTTTKSTQQQSTTQTQTAPPNMGEPPTMEAKQAPAKQADAAKQTQTTASVAPNKPLKPLSTNEDPSMIGKRNINGGFIGKIAGGTEKEVRQGREAAAEVDRQAKFIEDPLITEYVNRVGQNIVLHSDAKVPFTIKVIDSD